jgi:tetratricopeptide (TPR) repeat protein
MVPLAIAIAVVTLAVTTELAARRWIRWKAEYFVAARRTCASVQPLKRFALGGVGFIGRFGGLYPTYVRGLAYLAARRPTEATAEFQRILDHRSIVLVDSMDAMARLELARALALAGDTVKAKRTYDDLLALWKNADAKIPILQQARTEYARLP